MTQWRIDDPTTLHLEGVRRLEVRIVAGAVDVVGQPSDDDERNAHIEVSELSGPLIITQDGDTLTISHEQLSWNGLLGWLGQRKTRAVVSVTVDERCEVELGVVVADALVAGIVGPTAVKSVSGNLTLDGVSADIEARTVSGDLESRGLAGSLDFETVSGDLTVVEGSSHRVRAETVSGQMLLDLDVSDDSRIDLSSISGDLTLRLPETASLQVNLRTMSGDLDCEFAGVTARKKPGHAVLRGQVGEGAGALRARTVSGDVTLLRRGWA